MNSSPNSTVHPKGFLLMCGCLVLLAHYWLFVGPLWKYGSYTFLCLLGVLGLLVALTAQRGYRSLGVLVVTASILLAYQTHAERKAWETKAERRLAETEARMLDELAKSAPPSPKQSTR